jgi:hypothetical protein
MSEAEDKVILQRIRAVFQSAATRPTEPPPSRAEVIQWMNSEDLEVLGALCSLVWDKERRSRIQPPLTFEDCHQFLMRYYRRCILEDPEGEWVDSRYSAAGDLARWFNLIWRDSTLPRSALPEIKTLFAGLCREGDNDLRTCVETAGLEHMINDPAVAEYFSDWLLDPVLKAPYVEVLSWFNQA